jgi:hypothetical protein
LDDLSADQMAMLERIEAAIQSELEACDPAEMLEPDHIGEIKCDVLDQVFGVMEDEKRTELDPADRAHIKQTVRRMARDFLVPPAPLRFKKLDRVVCNVGSERGWAAGSVQALNEDDSSDPTGQRCFPYIVKMDPPNSRLVSVPEDTNAVVRAEVCFGQRAGAGWFTRMSAPRTVRKGSQRVRRFGVHDRVVCAVEDATDAYTDWAAGTVRAVDHFVADSEGAAAGSALVVPYEVLLDSGCAVLVHADEHWLIRDLALQLPGPRIAADGTRSLDRMSKRKAGDGWEMMDHTCAATHPDHGSVRSGATQPAGMLTSRPSCRGRTCKVRRMQDESDSEDD